MRKIYFVFFILLSFGSLNAQHTLEFKIDNSVTLRQPNAKTAGDSLNYVIYDTNKRPYATIVVRISDGETPDKLEFSGTINLKNWRKISNSKYRVFMQDDGLHDQILYIDCPRYEQKKIVSNDNFRFVGGKKYTLSVWTKTDVKGPIDYNPEFKMYSGLGLNPVLQLAPIVNVGFDYYHWNVWLSASYSLAHSEELYVYNTKNELLGSHKYSYLRLGLNVGYEWEPWEKISPLFSVMPQAEIAWDQVYSSQKDVSANGFTAYNVVVGARLAFKTNNRRFCFFATPGYTLNIGSNPKSNFEQITNIDDLKSLKPSFDLQVGVLYYF